MRSRLAYVGDEFDRLVSLHLYAASCSYFIWLVTEGSPFWNISQIKDVGCCFEFCTVYLVIRVLRG